MTPRLRDVDGRRINYISDRKGGVVGAFADFDLYEETAPFERIFYIKVSLWRALAQVPAPWVPVMAAAAIWPFDVTTIRFIDAAIERPERSKPDDVYYKRLETRFVRRYGKAESDQKLQIVSLFSKMEAYAPDVDLHPDAKPKPVSEGTLRQAIAYSGEGNGSSSDMWTYAATGASHVDDTVDSDPSGSMGGLITLLRFIAFCDMLTYDRHLVTARKWTEHKKKRVPWMTLANAQARSAYEIVLRPEFTILEAAESVGHALDARERARPRRHMVAEYTRIRNGKIELVRSFERGGNLSDSAPRPVYNTMPLARWYKQGEK